MKAPDCPAVELPVTARGGKTRTVGMVHFSLIVLGLMVMTVSEPQAFQIQVTPEVIRPGDPFILKVTGVQCVPEAVFMERQLQMASCGERCFFAIGAADLKTKPGRYRVAVAAASKKKSVFQRIARHAFPVIRLSLPDEKVTLSEEDLARALREEQILKALWQNRSEPAWNGGFVMPLENEISTGYGVRRILNKKNESVHRGVDIKGKEGDAVRAANSGRVVLAEELFFGGNTLVLDHGQGIFTVYMHLLDFNVTVGEGVGKGGVIGFVGSTGRSSGPHLHFGVKVVDVSINPASFMRLQMP